MAEGGQQAPALEHLLEAALYVGDIERSVHFYGQVLDAWAAQLAAHNVPIEERITWPNGARSVYFRDPDGNCLEFAEPKLWKTA